jgi:hypothetical protein
LEKLQVKSLDGVLGTHRDRIEYRLFSFISISGARN